MQFAYLELASDLVKNNLAPCLVTALRSQFIIHDSKDVDIIYTMTLFHN